MAVVFTENQYYQDIADAIRSKNGSSDTYLPSEMAAAIEAISGGGGSAITVIESQDTNGGVIKDIVAVNISDTTATASDVANGKYFYTANGTKTQGTASGSTVTLQTKSVTPTESAQTITADSGYDGLEEVDVAAISSSYVGSGITRRSSSDLSASGATVTAPAGYYASAASKSVASGSATTPSTTITANPTISVSSSGLITSSVSGSQSVTPTVSAGYVSSGTAGTVSVSGSKTQQLATKGATTITPTTSSQQAVASGVYTTGAITVAAIPSNYIDVSTTTTYSYGTGDPTSSTQGDIYLKVVS